MSALGLSFLVLPVLVSATREALLAVPGALRQGLAALGFSKGQTVRLVLLPTASRGILGGVILALGRAAEDAAVIMVTHSLAQAWRMADHLHCFHKSRYLKTLYRHEMATERDFMEFLRGLSPDQRREF